MTEEQNRINAILAMGENTVTTLWDVVVIRGIGMNWKLGSVNGRYLGVMDTVRGLS